MYVVINLQKAYSVYQYDTLIHIPSDLDAARSALQIESYESRIVTPSDLVRPYQ
eukprot:SAG31_NODE_3387_length_4330_cov_3.992437_6_plen_54_part_00